MTDYDRAAEYRRGYEDGARSLDAERGAVVARLRALTFVGGSHTDLSAIGHAVMPDAGQPWTPDECRALAERIVELMGGAHVAALSPSVTPQDNEGRTSHAGDNQP